MQKHSIRTKTITEILRRRPDAFDKREKKDEGCKCKKVSYDGYRVI